MKAVISNAKHPEYGQVTIPFPIPAEQYENVLGLLDALKIGDTLEQDCQVNELYGHYTVLKRLEGATANTDELDYLVMRLESFCEVEDAQFQGMAVKLGISDIRDFINLTFCCQEATVITDFSNWEKIGKDHLMTINGGCMPTAQHDRADGRHVNANMKL